jgi:hypothetical protein
MLAETCQRAIARATKLTGQMRSFGMVQDARLATVDAGSAVGNVLPMLHSALPRNIALTAEVPADLWPVTVDALRPATMCVSRWPIPAAA